MGQAEIDKLAQHIAAAIVQEWPKGSIAVDAKAEYADCETVLTVRMVPLSGFGGTLREASTYRENAEKMGLPLAALGARIVRAGKPYVVAGMITDYCPDGCVILASAGAGPSFPYSAPEWPPGVPRFFVAVPAFLDIWASISAGS
jgi:hypothetical protein